MKDSKLPKVTTKSTRRVGRGAGSGRGKTSGRGQKAKTPEANSPSLIHTTKVGKGH